MSGVGKCSHNIVNFIPNSLISLKFVVEWTFYDLKIYWTIPKKSFDVFVLTMMIIILVRKTFLFFPAESFVCVHRRLNISVLVLQLTFTAYILVVVYSRSQKLPTSRRIGSWTERSWRWYNFMGSRKRRRYDTYIVDWNDHWTAKSEWTINQVDVAIC